MLWLLRETPSFVTLTSTNAPCAKTLVDTVIVRYLGVFGDIGLAHPSHGLMELPVIGSPGKEHGENATPDWIVHSGRSSRSKHKLSTHQKTNRYRKVVHGMHAS